MKGLTLDEQRDLFEFLAFNVLERTVRRYEKVRNLFSAVKKIGTLTHRKLLKFEVVWDRLYLFTMICRVTTQSSEGDVLESVLI